MSEQGQQLDYTVIGLWACLCAVGLALLVLIFIAARSVGVIAVAGSMVIVGIWLACTESDTDGA